MNDHFSTHPADYARYRPTYPDELFTYLRTILPGTENAWDCATGNGQAAKSLAAIFSHVYATDISQSQLDNAMRLPNLHYSVQPAEATNFPADFFDLIMVAQAVHWFDFTKFYTEVARTARRKALLVIAGYGRLSITPEMDRIIDRLYFDMVGPYWNKERRYIDENYQTVPFPFEEIPAPAFRMNYEWTVTQLIGYLKTWSAVKHYQKANNCNPVELIAEELNTAWGRIEKQSIRFPLLLRIGRIEENRQLSR